MFLRQYIAKSLRRYPEYLSLVQLFWNDFHNNDPSSKNEIFLYDAKKALFSYHLIRVTLRDKENKKGLIKMYKISKLTFKKKKFCHFMACEGDFRLFFYRRKMTFYLLME